MSPNLAGLRVSLVCMYYWPETSGSAPYVTGVAEHLAAAGASVTVLTAPPHYPDWNVRPEYAGRAWSTEHHRGVQVLRARPIVPKRQSVLHRAAYEASWLLATLPRQVRQETDVVLASSPPLASLPLALLLRATTGAPVGAVVQDFYSQASRQSGISGGASVGGAVTRSEGRLLRALDLVGVIDEDFARTARSLGVSADRIRLLPNWTHIDPPKSTRQQARARLGWDDDVFRVVHTGNMGHKQGLENVVAAARLAAESSVPCAFVLVGDGNQRHILEQLGRGMPTLQFLPPVSAEEYPDLLQAADVLLVNERANATEMSLPSKITSYMATQRPILAAVPDGVTRNYLSRLGAATFAAPDNPVDLLDAVRKLMVDGARSRAPSLSREILAADVALQRYEDFIWQLLGQRTDMAGANT